jgi:hypothetical protein
VVKSGTLLSLYEEITLITSTDNSTGDFWDSIDHLLSKTLSEVKRDNLRTEIAYLVRILHQERDKYNSSLNEMDVRIKKLEEEYRLMSFKLAVANDLMNEPIFPEGE